MTTYVEGPLAGDVHRRLLGLEESIWQAQSFAPHANPRTDAVSTPRRARPSSAPNTGRRQVRAPDPMPWHLQPRPHSPGPHRPLEDLASGGFPRRQPGPAQRPQSARVGMAGENAGALGPATHLDRLRAESRTEAAVYLLEDLPFSDALRAEAGYHGHVECHGSDATMYDGISRIQRPSGRVQPASSSSSSGGHGRVHKPSGRPQSASTASSSRGYNGRVQRPSGRPQSASTASSSRGSHGRVQRPSGRPQSASTASSSRGSHGRVQRPSGRPQSASSASSQSGAGWHQVTRGGVGWPQYAPSAFSRGEVCSDSSRAAGSSARSERMDVAGNTLLRPRGGTYLGFGDYIGEQNFELARSDNASADYEASSSSSFAHQGDCAWNGGLSRAVQLNNMEDQHHFGTYDNSSVSGSSMTSYCSPFM